MKKLALSMIITIARPHLTVNFNQEFDDDDFIDLDVAIDALQL